MFILYFFVVTVIFFGFASCFELAKNSVLRGDTEYVYCLDCSENDQEYEIRCLMRLYPNSVILTSPTTICECFSRTYGRVTVPPTT